MKRKILTLIVLVMLLCLPLKAPAAEHTFAAGSFIIPMDSFYQPEADGGALEAYGMVYYLLNHKDTNGEHDITVYWVINQMKTAIDGIDLKIEVVDAATLEGLNKESVVKLYNQADGTTSVLSQYKTYDGGDDDSNLRVSYSGGVFIVEAEDVENAKTIIDNSGWLKVEVHEAQVPFSAPVFREMIGTPPKIALMNNDEDKTKGNAQILEAYLRLAGLCTDTYEVVTPNEIRDGKLRTAGYDFLWAPHWEGYKKNATDENGNGTPDVEDIVKEIKLFLESGKGMLAECASIETFEHSENGHFLSTKGFGHNQGTNDETRVIYNDVTGPNSQVGDFAYEPEGGHLHNWRPYHSGDNYSFDISPDVDEGDSAYVTTVTRFTVDDTFPAAAGDGLVDDRDWDYYVGGYAYGDTNNGYVVYLGGHRYASCKGSIAVEPEMNVNPLDFEFKKDVDKSDKVYTITFAVGYNDGADKSSGVTFTTDADFSDPALSIRSASYGWRPSGSGTGEYYLTTSAGGFTIIYPPSVVTANDFAMTAGTAGSLAAGKWDWADNDSLGYQTVYVRLADSTDPDTKAADYLEAEYVGDPLEIDLTTASVHKKKLLDVILRNNGSSDITVNSIGLLWSGGGGDAGEQRIKKITDTTTDVTLYDGEADTPFGLAMAGFSILALEDTTAGCTDNDDCEWKNIAGVRYVLNTLFNIKYQIQSKEYARSAPIVKHPWLYQGSFEYPSYFGHFRRYDVTAAEMDADWDTADAGIIDANNNNTDGRKVYTAELSGGDWSKSNFDAGNVSNLNTFLNVTPADGDTDDEEKVITRVRGKYWNSDNSQWVERANKLGGIMHSAPAIVDHNSRTGGRDEVAYVGDLYGMLHAIETPSGNEKWAFIPRNLLGKLKNDRTDPNAVQDFAAVDGSPAVKDVFYDHDGTDQWRTILVCTEGRGGNYVFALDVTDPDNWSVLWELTVEAILSYTGTGGFTPGDTVTGQTSGATGEVAADDTENGELSLKATVGAFQNGETVFEDLDNDGIIDNNEDNVTVTQKVEMGHAYRASVNRVKWPVKDNKGNITGYELKWVVYVATGYLNIAEDHGGINVFAFDLATGDKLWHFSDQYVDSVNDIPGAVTLFDTTGDQFVDRVYVGDMNGRLWELDAMDGTNPNGTVDVDGVTKQMPLWNAGVGKPISVSPAIIRDSGHVVLIFGTGGTDWAANDQAYSIYAVDATEKQTSPTYWDSDTEQGGAGTLLWEQTLDEGEKVWSTPTIAAGRIYVATASGTMESTDPGEDVAGTGYLYSLDLKTGDKAWTSEDNPDGRVDVGKGLSSVYVDRRHVYLTTINNEIRQIGDDDFTAGQANNVLLKAWREVW